MSAASVLTQGRRAAEARMTDRCIITRADSTAGVYDPDTMLTTPAAATVVWEGPCRLTAARAGTNDALSGEAVVGVGHWQLHVPVIGTEGVRSGHVATITSAASDPALVGTVFTVTDPAQASATSARRLEVERSV